VQINEVKLRKKTETRQRKNKVKNREKKKIEPGKHQEP